MDKVKKFLEAYVQWLALALGVAFLGWTVYGYVVAAPVTTTVNNRPGVAPGNVNNEVWDVAGKPLSDAINGNQAPPNMMPTVDYPKVIVGQLDEVPTAVATNMSTPAFPYWTPMDDTVGPDGHPDLAANKVEKLPEIPMLIDYLTLWSKGHSNVQPPKPSDNQTTPQPQEINKLLALDKQWITVGANIPVAALAQAFKDSKIPTNFSIATVYRVIAVRQEMDASGKWGNDTTLEPLDVNPMMPLPDKFAPFQVRQDYKTWAETQQNVVTICEPAFYPVLQGDIWYEPGFPNPNDHGNQMVVNPFDPSNPLAFKGDPNSLLPEEKKQYDEAVAAKVAADARKSRSQQQTPPSGYNLPPNAGTSGRGTGGRGGAGGGGGGRNAVPEPTPPNEGGLLQPPRPNHYNQPPPGYPGGGYPPMGQPQQNPQGPAMPASSVATLPNPGSFSPADRAATAAATGATANIKVWVHDTNVVAGKTYHYKLKYIISNPVAGTTNLCKHDADAKQAWLESDWTPWGTDISVDSDSNFYAVDAKHGIRFDIFKWQEGVWRRQSVYVNPGDRIGNTDSATKTNFDTGWTLVDIREDPAGNNENKVLVLVSDNGTVKEKEIAIDRLSDKYRKLLGEVQAAAEKTASR